MITEKDIAEYTEKYKSQVFSLIIKADIIHAM